MKESDSVFGVELDRLKQLLTVGKEESRADSSEQTPRPASFYNLMERPGMQIGRYKLLRILGEGGMGIVYLAEQEEPVKRQVALKVIKPGMDSKRVIARFETEKQALALMQHPNIAGVYDAGLTLTGRPYFVMEYVKGMPITDYCDHNKLTINERLQLFQQVCQAVQHAHQKGIIHRDIKPSNILVSVENSQAIPKIIDFGIAKATDKPLTERTLATEDTQLLGTPEYMSPEQADMVTEDIDTRSDVYSLGVLLYVLLTGVLPFDPEKLRENGIENVRKTIRQVDPKTPSTRLTKLGEEATTIAQNRQTEISTLARNLRKELEWIPLKAMRKERSERYRSVSDLADDIENYLSGIPLIAGPPGKGYQVKKFVQRNLALVAGITALVAILIAGVVVSTTFAVRAERQVRITQAINDFLCNDLLASADPLKGVPHGASFEAILGVASERLEGRFETEPIIESIIRYRIGLTYYNLGNYEAAESALKRALELRRNRRSNRDWETLLTMKVLGWVHYCQSEYDEAEPLLTESVDGMRAIFDEENPRLLGAISRLAWLYYDMRRYEEAERLQADALEVVQRKLGPESPYAPNHMEGLAAAYWKQGCIEEAEELLRKALDVSRRHPRPGEANTESIFITHFLGTFCQELGRYNEAEELYIEALGARRKMYGEEHTLTLAVLDHLGSLYCDMERYEEAEKLLIEAEETARRVFGNDHRITVKCVNDLIELYESWNKPEEATKWREKLPQTEAVN
ncbi:MAG: serine/threonine protein kinase [Planctomycetota bacterium]|jgi:non-specific serine/threonine protein kinase/serine/threonine-protein kinase